MYGESSWVLAVYIAENVTGTLITLITLIILMTLMTLMTLKPSLTGKSWRELFTEYVGTASGLDESCNYNSMAGEGVHVCVLSYSR